MSSVYNTPEWSAWLASIREMPDDDLPRLVYADFLEERGEGERAEFIRLQVDLAKPKYKTKSGRPRLRLKRTARERERSILLSRAAWWTPGVEVVTSDKWRRTLGNTAVAAWYERGFITRVSGPLASLIGGECGRCASRRRMARQIERLEGEAAGVDATGLADDLMDLHDPCPDCNGTGRTPGVLWDLVKREPVMKFEVTDREPMPSSSRDQTGPCIWWDANHQGGSTIHPQSDLPTDLFFCLEGEHLTTGSRWYPTADAARAALSSAILRLVQPVEVPT